MSPDLTACLLPVKMKRNLNVKKNFFLLIVIKLIKVQMSKKSVNYNRFNYLQGDKCFKF